ncbi:hypothetical protein LshimejAT787_0212290 [Lyophyllum shimeji]|uniref:Uncharacterized protein n=1 Tax=Lyophyllum shimeji TaxID=47721 RepID=A0A9P3UIK3_LYOSH|nr:hypothetical protein LshimejAT787_0212290 [Lyophyllum shimeji]
MVKQSKPLTGATPRNKGKGKRFLDNDAALDLAAAIADAQEGKSLNKVEKHRQVQAVHPRVDQKSKPSSSKLKLKQTKARLVAQRTQVRKEKTKRRKQHSEDKAANGETGSGSATEIPKTVARKSVSFA